MQLTNASPVSTSTHFEGGYGAEVSLSSVFLTTSQNSDLAALTLVLGICDPRKEMWRD